MTNDTFRKTGIILSITLGLIFLTAAIFTCLSQIWPGMESKLISQISSNWLITIYKLHSKTINIETDPLTGVNLYDIIILTLFILICICLLITNKNQNRVWFLTSISLLFLGIIIFLITKIAGRSSFMAAGLIISTILLTKGFNYKIEGSIGLIANLLLILGDFSVGTNLKLISVLFGLGYVIMIIWIFLIAGIFIQTEIQNKPLTF